MALFQRFSNTLVTKLYLFLCTFLIQYLHQTNTQKHGLKRKCIRYTNRIVFMSRTTIGVSLNLTFSANFIVTLLTNDYQDGLKKMTYLESSKQGFGKDHSTIDHIFTLFSMIQRHLLRNKKLYVAFIDLRKSFDFISHCKLWPILNKTGIKGKLLQTTQSMYRILKLAFVMETKWLMHLFVRKV